MMQRKRIPASLDQSSSSSSCLDMMPKRLKTQEGKEKLNERITTLQQLVSPYGKTDTASVLLDALEYIRFLHEQVKVLSAPYLYSAPMRSQEEACGLKAKGLCLVPLSFTVGVASSNGADIWAPAKTNSTRLFPDQFSIVKQ